MEVESMTKQAHMNRLWWMASAVVLLFVALAVMPVAASVWPDNHQTTIPIANQPPRFQYQSSTGYYFNMSTATGGMNAIHITNCNASTCFAGGVYTSNELDDTFYVSDTGGRGGQDDILLLVAVNSTDSTDWDNFAITINASGYKWIPTSTGYIPAWDPNFPTNNLAYWNGSFTYVNFTEYSSEDVLQNWKFAPTADYPLFNTQAMNEGNVSKIMLIDLNLGTVGNQSQVGKTFSKTYYENLTDFGMVNVTYHITGPSRFADNAKVAFNAYAYSNWTTKEAQGVNWLNRVYKEGDDNLIITNSSGWVYTPS
jgi:hypothetical protein